jgi:hypothetical protein
MPVILANPDGLRWLAAQPAFSTWLAHTTGESVPVSSPEIALMRLQRIDSQTDWPVGAWRVAQTPGLDPAKRWFCATFMTQHAARDHVVVGGEPVLTETEFSALFAALDDHFSQDRISLVRTPWGLCLHDPLITSEVSTTPAEDAHGMALSEVLPEDIEISGASSKNRPSSHLVRLMSEAQMLLHQHPVNHERELRGEPLANSLWLWGGGVGASDWKTTETPWNAADASGQSHIANWLANAPEACDLVAKPASQTVTPWKLVRVQASSLARVVFWKRKTLKNYGLSGDFAENT